jgi:hypothetical protein
MRVKGFEIEEGDVMTLGGKRSEVIEARFFGVDRVLLTTDTGDYAVHDESTFEVER